MFNFFKKLTINKNKIWSFSGGIFLPKIKIQSNNTPLTILPLPNELIIPIKQHIGLSGNIIVNINDYVLKGQALTEGFDFIVPVHASTSGTITNISSRITTHNFINEKEFIIKLKPDNKDKCYKYHSISNYLEYSTKSLISYINQAGIAGLGGAGFPTSIKLKNGNNLINTLIINAAESEPYITADDRLIQEHAKEIIEGILILIYILKPKKVLIGIEDNKPEAILAFKKACLNQNEIIQLRIIPTKYPSGSSRQLIKILTGKEVPSGFHSSIIGILMHNVSTVFAIKRAIINSEPLIQRVITLTGSGIKKPANYWVRLGTPINFILNQVGLTLKSKPIVVVGGPLMGFILSDLTTPIVKINNCIIVPTVTEINNSNTEKACIRCGFCSEVCPVNLLPQQLYWFSKGQDHDKVKEYNLFDCIECGACTYICPSNIPLVQYYQQEKAEINFINKEKQRILDAKKRFEFKKIRLNKEIMLRKELNNKNKNKIYNIKEIKSCNIQKNNLEQENLLITTSSQSITNIKKSNLYKIEVAAAIERVKAKKRDEKKK